MPLWLQVPSALSTPCLQQLSLSVQKARDRLSLLEAQLQELRFAAEGDMGQGMCVSSQQQQQQQLLPQQQGTVSACGGLGPRRGDGILIAEILGAQRDLLLSVSKKVRLSSLHR